MRWRRFISALAVLTFLFLTAASTAPTASRLQISIHEQGIDSHNSGPNGKFTIDLALPGFKAGGTTHISNAPGATKYVAGQQQIPFGGEDTLTSSKGKL